MFLPTFWLISLGFAMTALGDDPPAKALDFHRDVRPVLADKCFRCHGPDEKARRGQLRLDQRESAIAMREGTAAIVPGRPDQSELMKRIEASDGDLRMPPPDSKLELSAHERDTLRRWIASGAEYQAHWAFVPPRRAATPTVANVERPLDPLDGFVLSPLEQAGRTFSPETDRATWLRRVTLDLTGLPPTLERLDEFLVDAAPDAHLRELDRLLASPAWGERMAVDWLDAARYADTHGYQVDPGKEMWPWRDWVVSAFNRNLPFDRFSIEQIAGDLLPDATLEQKIATGFQRNHRINSETGALAEEFQAENVVDRVNTFGEVWLGLTVGCARCHDHKYDPLTTREFYSLGAFFNNVDEVGNGGPRDARGNHRPYLRLPAPELEAKAAAKQQEIDKVRKTLDSVDDRLAPGQRQWEKGALSYRPRWTVLRPASLSADGGVTLATLKDGSIRAGGAMPPSSIYEVKVKTALRNITAFRIELIPDPSLPAGGSGRAADGKGVVTMFQVNQDGRKVDLDRITTDFQSEESELGLVLRPAEQLKRGWGVNPKVTSRHWAVIEPSRMLGGAAATEFTIRIGNEYEGAPVGRFRLSVTDSEYPEVIPEETAKIIRQAESQRSEKDRKELRAYYLAHPREHRKVYESVKALEAEKRAIENQIPTTMVMQEMAKARDTFVLKRGQYDQPGDRVTPIVPSFLPPLPSGAPANRLALARWLFEPANPLTARVAVNRYWQTYFGLGLVKTAEDFGSQGELPSHPELLDWLAVEFEASGWDVKAMQRLIVTSATYRQSSQVSPELRQRDPENRLLARGPRFRLQAEMIRDQALALSNLLSLKMGGPAVKPYQPDGLWEQLSAFQGRKLFERSKGEDLWRRSVYTYWKRTVPPPSMTVFDAPTREFCIVHRTLSSTPLQALALLNDEMYVETSRKFAERIIREGGATPRERLRWALRLATSRTPEKREIDILDAGLERRLTKYRANPAAANQLLSAGESPRDKQLDAAELAAYTTAASVILNLDEVITKQ